MGVINVTPDSFSDGDSYFDTDKAVNRGEELAAQGADIIDIGGESSRPGSDPVSAEEEMRRILPVISKLRKRIQVLISVDTTKSEVARAALDEGADIINDISSFRFDPHMGAVVAQKKVPVVLMHMQGTPKTMQTNPYYEDVVGEVKDFLREKIEQAQALGIKKEKIIIDPGIGFGKRMKDNLTLINNLHSLEDLQRPILVGVSRKSFIGRILDLPPQDRLEGTIASSILSLMRGAHILRIHDVEAVRRAIQVAEAIMGENFYPSSLQKNTHRKNNHVC